MPELIYREDLLHSFAKRLEGLENEGRSLQSTEAHLKLADGTVVLKTSPATALNFIVNDVYWDEESNWSEAVAVEFVTL